VENTVKELAPAGPDVTRREGVPESVGLTVPPVDSLRRTLRSGTDLGGTRRPSLVAAIAGGGGALADRYTEERVLGKGGMGVVVLANDRDLARPVAVKKLLTAESEHASTVGAATDGDDVRRFLREAQVTAQLEHPGVLPIHDVGMDEKQRFYYVMRLVRGERNLRSVIDALKKGDEATHRDFTFERRVRIVQQICQVLAYAHSKGVIHRDVKPENIMLGPFGEVYLVDWGLAKLVSTPDEPRKAGAAEAELAPSETRAGSILGTPLYMSPEQANGDEATKLSDVYSLTAVLYELLTLRHYLGETPSSTAKLVNAILTQTQVPAERIFDAKNGRVSRGLSRTCDRGLAKEPAKRFASTADLEKELERWLEGQVPVLCQATLTLMLIHKLRKAIERNPAPVMIALNLVGAAMLGMLGLVGYGAWHLLAG
jgi:serine/threonine-protein kinase